MKEQIKLMLAVAAVAAFVLPGCSGNKEGKTDSTGAEAQAAVADADIRGKWYIENIVFNDSDYVRPNEAVPGVSQYIVFEDSTYYIKTNCNSISGAYAIKSDSITLGDGPMTEMACDNMATEDALRRILPSISTVEVQNDTVIRLKGSVPAEYILLGKANTEVE